MSITIKQNASQCKKEDSDEEIPNPQQPNLDFSISEKDVRETLKNFVKGMNEAEMHRFLAIYRKY